MEQRKPAVELVDTPEIKESKKAEPTLGTTLLNQLYAADATPETRKNAINTILEIASQLSLDKQKEFVTEYCAKLNPGIDLREFTTAYCKFVKDESSLKTKQSAFANRRAQLYTILEQVKNWYNNAKDETEKKKFKKEIKMVDKAIKECNEDYAKIKSNLYDEQNKADVKLELQKIYQTIPASINEQSLPERAKMEEVLKNLCKSPENYIGNLFSATLRVVESTHTEPTPLELRHTFQSHIKIDDCLYISPKSGGANDPGQYGGNYLLCYQTADGRIHSQIIFFKQATDDGFANHRENIAEVMAGHIMNGIVGNHAAAIVLAMPKKVPAGEADSNPDAAYVGSFFFKEFGDFHTRAHEAAEEEAKKSGQAEREIKESGQIKEKAKKKQVERGKAAFGAQRIHFPVLGNPDFRPGFIALSKSKKFSHTNLAKALMANLLVGNYQIHTQNGGLAKVAGKMEPVTFDFGGAFRRSFVTYVKTKEQPGQFPRAVRPEQSKGRKYDAAYLLAFPQEVRKSAEFIKGIDVVADFDSNELRKCVDKAVDYQVRYYGKEAFIKYFACKLDTRQIELDLRNGSLDGKLAATKTFLYNRLFLRQLSLRHFSLQQKEKHPGFDNTTLRRDNPIYFRYYEKGKPKLKNKGARKLALKQDIAIMQGFLNRTKIAVSDDKQISSETKNLANFLTYALTRIDHSFDKSEDQEIITQALNETYRAVTTLLEALPEENQEKQTILNGMNKQFSDVEIGDLPEHKLEPPREEVRISNILPEAFNMAAKGNLEGLQEYFDAPETRGHKDDINLLDDQGYTLLMYAAANGHTNVVEYLLPLQPEEAKGNAEPLKSRDGRTPLMLAVDCYRGSSWDTTIALLAKQQANAVNAIYPDGSGDTVLTRAVKQRNVKLIEALVKIDGINIDHRDSEGNDALMIAIKDDHVGIGDVLRHAPGAPDKLTKALFLAIAREDRTAIFRLKLAGADIDQALPASVDINQELPELVDISRALPGPQTSPLLYAIQNGKYLAAHQLREQGAILQNLPRGTQFPPADPNSRTYTAEHEKVRAVFEAIHRLGVPPEDLPDLDQQDPPVSRATSSRKKARKIAEILFWVTAFTIIGLAVASFSVFSFGLPAIILTVLSVFTVASTALSAIMLRFTLMNDIDSNWDHLFLDLYPEVEYAEALRHAKTLSQHRPLPDGEELNGQDIPADFIALEDDTPLEDFVALKDREVPADFVALPASPVQDPENAAATQLMLNPAQREKLLNMVNSALGALMIKGERQRIVQYGSPDGAGKLNDDIRHLTTMQFYLQRLKADPQRNNLDVIASVLNCEDFRKAYKEFKEEDHICTPRENNTTILGRLRNTKLHPKSMRNNWLGRQADRFSSWFSRPPAAGENAWAWGGKRFMAAIIMLPTAPYWIAAGIEWLHKWANSPTYAEPNVANAANDEQLEHLLPAAAQPRERSHWGKNAVRLLFILVIGGGLLFLITALTLAMFKMPFANKLVDFILDKLLMSDSTAAGIMAKETIAPAITWGVVGGSSLVLLGAAKASLKVNATSYQEFKPIRDKLLYDQEVRLQHFDTEGPVDFGWKNNVLLYLSASTFGLSEVVLRSWKLRPYRVCVGYRDGKPIGEQPANLSWKQWKKMAWDYYDLSKKEGQRNLLRSLIKSFTLIFIVTMAIYLTTLAISVGLTPVGWGIAASIIVFYTVVSAFKWWRNRKPAPEDTKLAVAGSPIEPDYNIVNYQIPERLLPNPGPNPVSPANEDDFGLEPDFDPDPESGMKDHKHVGPEIHDSTGLLEEEDLEEVLLTEEEYAELQAKGSDSEAEEFEDLLRIIRNGDLAEEPDLPGIPSSSIATDIPLTITESSQPTKPKPHERKNSINSQVPEFTNLEGRLKQCQVSFRIAISMLKCNIKPSEPDLGKIQQFDQTMEDLSRGRMKLSPADIPKFKKVQELRDELDKLIKEYNASNISKGEEKGVGYRSGSPTTSSSTTTTSQPAMLRAFNNTGPLPANADCGSTRPRDNDQKRETKSQTTTSTGANNSAAPLSASMFATSTGSSNNAGSLSAGMFGHSGKTSKRPDGKLETKSQTATNQENRQSSSQHPIQTAETPLVSSNSSTRGYGSTG